MIFPFYFYGVLFHFFILHWNRGFVKHSDLLITEAQDITKAAVILAPHGEIGSPLIVKQTEG